MARPPPPPHQDFIEKILECFYHFVGGWEVGDSPFKDVLEWRGEGCSYPCPLTTLRLYFMKLIPYVV